MYLISKTRFLRESIIYEDPGIRKMIHLILSLSLFIVYLPLHKLTLGLLEGWSTEKSLEHFEKKSKSQDKKVKKSGKNLVEIKKKSKSRVKKRKIRRKTIKKVKKKSKSHQQFSKSQKISYTFQRMIYPSIFWWRHNDVITSSYNDKILTDNVN